MTVLITRPVTDATATAARLEAAGFATLVAPLMTIAPRPDVSLDLDGVQGVLITSANGVRALALATSRRDLAVFAVGAGSAAAARRAGFSSVESADGDVAALATLVAERADRDCGRLVHVAGRVTAGGDGNGLAARLTETGFTVDRVVLYDAVAAASLPEDAARALTNGEVTAVALYSPRSALLLLELAAAAGFADAWAGVVAVCLSPAVAAVAEDGGFDRIVVAEAPHEDSLVEVLTATLQVDAQTATS